MDSAIEADPKPGLKTALIGMANITPLLLLALLVVAGGHVWIGPKLIDLLSHVIEFSGFIQGKNELLPVVLAQILWDVLWSCTTEPLLVLLPAIAVARARVGDALGWGAIGLQAMKRWPIIVIPFAFVEIITFVGYQLLLPGVFIEILCTYVIISLVLGSVRGAPQGALMPWIKRPFATLGLLATYWVAALLLFFAVRVPFMSAEDIFGSFVGASQTPPMVLGLSAAFVGLLTILCNGCLASFYLDWADQRTAERQ